MSDSLFPDDPRRIVATVHNLIARHDTKRALEIANHALRLHPNSPASHVAMSIVHLAMGDPLHARTAAARAVDLDVTAAPAHLQLAHCERRLGNVDAVRVALAQAVACGAKDPLVLDQAAGLRVHFGDHDAALTLYNEALALTPDAPGVLYNRAAVLRFLGRLDEAETDYDRVIALNPDDHEAWLNRSQLRRQSVARNHVAALRGARDASSDTAWLRRVHLDYALGKELEDLGSYNEAFRHYAAGAAMRRRHLRYDVSDDVAAIDAITRTFDHSYFANAANGTPEAAPIFVLGLPRSGTSLVERILGSHPEIHPAGELTAFGEAVETLGRRHPARGQGKHMLIALSADFDPAVLGREYIRHAAPWVGAADRFTDKLPLNYLYAGLVTTALPRARIVHVRRHPMAVGYGMFKTLFNQGYPFSYDLGEIARYIAAYHRLMAHWRAVLPIPMIEIEYALLVADQQKETRRLVDACGLSWDDACLRPEKSRAASTTHSASQIRTPVYTSAVEHWRHFAPQLAPLRDALASEGIDPDAPGP